MSHESGTSGEKHANWYPAETGSTTKIPTKPNAHQSYIADEERRKQTEAARAREQREADANERRMLELIFPSGVGGERNTETIRRGQEVDVQRELVRLQETLANTALSPEAIGYFQDAQRILMEIHAAVAQRVLTIEEMYAYARKISQATLAEIAVKKQIKGSAIGV